MKNLFLCALAVLLFVNISIAQTDNFIRIVGNSITTVQYSGLRIKLQLEEIIRDEYQKVREKDISEIKSELNAQLIDMGYSLDDLEEIWPPTSSYARKKQEYYYLTVESLDKAKEIAKIDISGLKATEYRYTFPEELNIDDGELASHAIDDARRKAESLATKVGKKVGKVLNIEDKSIAGFKVPDSARDESYTYKYTLTITYELLD